MQTLLGMKAAEKERDFLAPQLGMSLPKQFGARIAWHIHAARNDSDRIRQADAAVIVRFVRRERAQASGASQITGFDERRIQRLLEAFMLQGPAIEHAVRGDDIGALTSSGQARRHGTMGL